MSLSLNHPKNPAALAGVVIVAGLTALGALHYPGIISIYLLFSLVSHALLGLAFAPKGNFFDLFAGLFLWLGFWLKTTLTVAVFKDGYYEGIGAFDFSGASYDQALLVATTGLGGLLLARLARPSKNILSMAESPRGEGIIRFYSRHRLLLWILFGAVSIAVAGLNLGLGIYQRGCLPRTILPGPLQGILTWLLLFGLSAVSAVFLHAETRTSDRLYFPTLMALLENFLSSTSMLSRAMIMNSSSLLAGLFKDRRHQKVQTTRVFWLFSIVATATLFAFSVPIADTLRNRFFTGIGLELVFAATNNADFARELGSQTQRSLGRRLLVGRWVGIEGVMAVASKPKKGWLLFWEALREKKEKKLSFYDATFIDSPYIHADKERLRHISLPGAVAFFFYPGSHIFLFLAMFLLGLIGWIMERITFLFSGGNLVLCALISQTVAYRFCHFGYAPRDSYLLFGTILLTVFLVWFTDFLLRTVLKVRDF